MMILTFRVQLKRVSIGQELVESRSKLTRNQSYPQSILSLAYISRLTPKCRMICRLTPKSCVMYAGLRLAKTFVCCCPDQLNKRLTDSKIESVRRKLCSVRAKSTFVVASSQSQRVAFMTRSARGGADRYVAGSARIIRGD